MPAKKINFRKYVLNCRPSRETERDWTWEHALEAGGVSRISSASLPTNVDLRNDEWPVRDQRLTGACVGFATADGVLRYHYAKRGLIGFSEMPSPRFIWMADKETDSSTQYPTTFIENDGTFIKHALELAQQYGCVMEEDLPMDGALWQGTREAFYIKAARFRIASFNTLGSDPKVWRKWLATGGPILTRLDVDQAWYDATANQGVLATYTKPGAPAGHAVCLVGYTKDGFIVRNSWGPTWGDNGFAYASNAYAAAAFVEAYGAVM